VRTYFWNKKTTYFLRGNFSPLRVTILCEIHVCGCFLIFQNSSCSNSPCSTLHLLCFHLEFVAMRDQFEALPTRLSNMGGHNKCHHRPLPPVLEEDKHDDGYKSGIPSANCRTQGRQPPTEVMPLGGRTSLNSTLQNSKGVYNLKNS
jgi:hypothetical protein